MLNPTGKGRVLIKIALPLGNLIRSQAGTPGSILQQNSGPGEDSVSFIKQGFLSVLASEWVGETASKKPLSSKAAVTENEDNTWLLSGYSGYWPVWILLWILRFSERANSFPQPGQLHSNGFSPVWTRRWLTSLYLALKGFPSLQNRSIRTLYQLVRTNVSLYLTWDTLASSRHGLSARAHPHGLWWGGWPCRSRRAAPSCTPSPSPLIPTHKSSPCIWMMLIISNLSD